MAIVSTDANADADEIEAIETTAETTFVMKSAKTMCLLHHYQGATKKAMVSTNATVIFGTTFKSPYQSIQHESTLRACSDDKNQLTDGAHAHSSATRQWRLLQFDQHCGRWSGVSTNRVKGAIPKGNTYSVAWRKFKSRRVSRAGRASLDASLGIAPKIKVKVAVDQARTPNGGRFEFTRIQQTVNDLERTHEAQLLEINTSCSLHITPENGVQQKLDNLMKTTRNNSEIDSDTDEVLIISAHNLKSQTDRMVTRGKGIFPPLKVGDNVLFSIPSVDRGRGDAANLLSVIIKENDGKFRIATKEGILSTWLERISLTATKYCSLTTADVQHSKMNILVRLGSVGTGQGYRRCTCRTNCTSKKCTCKKNDMMRNSVCHPGRSCQNL
ncbi:hypothetical protein QTP88_002966 [Uroleucon formosanum]